MVRSPLDLALERYRSAPRLILDVRMNGGGNDQLAFEIAGRFARTAVVTGYVRFRNGPGHADFGPPTQRLLNPRGAWQYDGAVQLLMGLRRRWSCRRRRPTSRRGEIRCSIGP